YSPLSSVKLTYGVPIIWRWAPASGRPLSCRKIRPTTVPNSVGPAESRGGAGWEMQRSELSGSQASIGRVACGPAPARVISRGRPKMRWASDSRVAACSRAGAEDGGVASAFGSPRAGGVWSGLSVPLVRVASGGALGSGSGSVWRTAGGRGGGAGRAGGGGRVGSEGGT